MSRMKDLWIDREGYEEGDLLAMQHEYGMAAIADLEGHLAYLAWRVEFYAEDVTLAQIKTIQEDLERIKKILL